MVRLLLLALCVLGLASAQTLRLDTPRGVVTAYQNAVALRTADGTLLWRTTVPADQVLDLLALDDRLFLNVLRLEPQQHGGVLALNLSDGQPLWTSVDEGAAPEVSRSAPPMKRGWGLLEDRLWWTSTSIGGAYMAQSTTVLDTRSGRRQLLLSGVVLARQFQMVLLRPDAPTRPWDEPEVLRLGVWNTAADAERPVVFPVRPRPGCGALVDDAEIFQNILSGPHLTALRRDGCGLFRAQFRWDGPEDQTPAILPAP